MPMTEELKMPFTEHLQDLRKRLVVSVIAIFVGFVICYAFKEKIFELLIRPWVLALPKGQMTKLIYTAPHEAFFTYLKVSFIAGTGLAIPVIVYQLWLFIAPGLYEKEKLIFIPVVLASTLFFAGGAMFGYFVVFPFGFQFFTSFASDFITPMISTREFLSFSVRMLLAFGFVFELPIFCFLLAKLGMITSGSLKRKRKIAIVMIFVIAAAITPSPDVMSQLLMAGPLLVLYELSVWIVYFTGHKDETEEVAPPAKPDRKEGPDSTD
jgi:sec-independent protein translocase protein TatC